MQKQISEMGPEELANHQEPGVEDDYTLENLAMSLFGGPSASIAKKAVSYGAKQVAGAATGAVKQSALQKLRNQVPKPDYTASGSVGSGYYQPKPDIKASPGVLTYSYPGRK